MDVRVVVLTPRSDCNCYNFNPLGSHAIVAVTPTGRMSLKHPKGCFSWSILKFLYHCESRGFSLLAIESHYTADIQVLYGVVIQSGA